MQIINLINKDKGDIVYDIINFSDGEKHIKFITEINRKDSVKVICRITSMDELFIRTLLLSGAICGIAGLLLVGGIDHTITTSAAGGRGFTAVMVSWLAKFNPVFMIFSSLLLVVLSRGAGEISTIFGLNHSFGDILNRMEVEWALVITYLMGMRMDRIMSFNEAFSLKIVTKTINDMHPDAVFVVEPHSDRTLKLINNSTPLMNHFAEAAMTDPEHNYMIVFPDAGAKLRYGEALENKVPMMTCHKKRDPATGKLSGFGIDNPEVLNEYPECNAFFVIDDLCDGGGTFCGIADQLKELRPDFHRTLAITHAVAARGIYKVMDYYNDLFITNSYADWGNDQFVASNSDRIFVLDTEKYYFNA